MVNRLFAIVTFFCLGIGIAISSEYDFNADTEASATALQRWYNTNGLWNTTEWWNAANCIEALENTSAANNGQRYLPILANTYRLNCSSNFLNDYYDDEGWWALAWIHAYDLTGKARYLKMAGTIFGDLTNAWGDHCNGGLMWCKTRFYKNAIPNELFLSVAIRLHQRTPGDSGPGSYLDWAIREWDWFKETGMINKENLINDGLTWDCENNGRTTWTYNQGVILGGLTDLYKTTGDTNYLNEAVAIADATISTLIYSDGVLKEPCEDKGCGNKDTPQFKGIFIRNLAYLYDETGKAAYRDFLLKNAQSVWANDRNSKNQLGLRWAGPFDAADAARQSSAMMAVSALAEPMTEMLPFATGAGSVTFHHGVGAPAGNLGWTCNAANAPAPGLALSGECALLPAGKHVIHFRMSANVLKNSPDELVRLEVENDETGAVLASRAVRWNEFTGVGGAQDFALAFTNAADRLPLAFQVYWEAAAQAPEITMADVTIDGAHNWTGASLAHEIGRLDGLNGWEADSIRDRASGFLTKGPSTKELPPGRYKAEFELKVDNFNWDKSQVATLSVMDTASGRIIAQRNVTRNQFPDALYHTFTLNFKAQKNGCYDFRVYWNFLPQAPRLTERSVVVKSSRRI